MKKEEKTIKSYTDLKQSKKLAEILPLESADMHSEAKDIDGDMVFIVVNGLGDKTKSNYGSPVWSLSALLCCLPFPVLYMEMLGGMIFWCCECHFLETDEVVKREHHDNPIDACYEMILKLNELNLL